MQERGVARVGKGKKGGKWREGTRGKKEKREGEEGKAEGKKRPEREGDLQYQS